MRMLPLLGFLIGGDAIVSKAFMPVFVLGSMPSWDGEGLISTGFNLPQGFNMFQPWAKMSWKYSLKPNVRDRLAAGKTPFPLDRCL